VTDLSGTLGILSCMMVYKLWLCMNEGFEEDEDIPESTLEGVMLVSLAPQGCGVCELQAQHQSHCLSICHSILGFVSLQISKLHDNPEKI